MEQIISIIAIFSLGTLFHFLYEMSHHNSFIAIFAAVNESTWEHIKMALSATLIWSLIDGFKYGTNPNYFLAKFISLILIVVIIPAIFYSYTRLTKKNILWIDISTFLIAIAISQLSFYKILDLQNLGFIFNYVGCILMFLIFGFYMTATIQPIKSTFFKDPISNKYGIEGHPKH